MITPTSFCSISQFIKICLAFTMFTVGFLFVLQYQSKDVLRETFKDSINLDAKVESDDSYTSADGKSKCPNVLIQKNELLYLYDTTQPETPGINPTVFHNLEEYVEYMKYLHSQGIQCPVLYLQHVQDIQGGQGYRIYPSPEDLNAGLPFQQASTQIERNLIDAGRNKGSMPGYDSIGLDVGVYTPLDKMYHSPERVSDNAMDPHWGGPTYSKFVIGTGKYDDNTRKLLNVHPENTIFDESKNENLHKRKTIQRALSSTSQKV